MSSTTTTATPAAAPVELSTPIELSARHEKAVQNFKETLTDPFTNHVINSMGPETPERAREVFTSMIQHLHAFARDIQLLSPEWLLGVNTLNRAGQMSDENRNEGILVSDIVGLEALVDQITQKTLVKMSEGVVKAATFSAILGPFFRENAPRYPNGTDIVQKHLPNNPTVFMDGHIYDSETGNPVVGADIDLWHTNSNGLYDQQDPDQPDYNNRGKFTTDKDGYYSLKCLAPTSYSIPFDGPAGEILKLTGRHPMRPAHTHIMVRKEGFTTLVTQIYDSRDPYTLNDSVFAVKDSLIVNFVDSKRSDVKFDLTYDITLSRAR